MLFRQIVDSKLAQYAYLIGCQKTGEAILVDPERDIDRYLDLAERENMTIVAVAETHIHADFLSGAREFGERLGVTLYLSDEGDENWKYDWVHEPRENGTPYDAVLLRDGDTFSIGNIDFEVAHTPGHTPEHISFLVTDTGGGATTPMGILSGDFVFVGDLGRPDLLESAAGIHGLQEPSARQLFSSLDRFTTLPDYLQVWPAHGAGSACGKSLGAVPQTTVGYEKLYNASLNAADQGEQAFVDAILDGQPEPQLYFARMKRDNKQGPPVLGALPTPQHLTSAELGTYAERGDVLLIDTRLDRTSFMARHIPGSLYAPLNGSFNTVVGSLVADETTPIVLLVQEDRVEEAVRDLVRIGYDSIEAYADLQTLERYLAGEGHAESTDTIDFDDLVSMKRSEDVHILDVRYASEYAGGHIKGAQNLSYTRLPARLDEVPKDKTLLVHCASGARAAAATAYLAARGYDVQHVDAPFSSYAEHYDVETGEASVAA